MKKIIITLVGICALGILWFAYYAFSPLFRTVKVDEMSPNVQSDTLDPLNLAVAQIIGTAGHAASGKVHIVTVDDKKYIRYEDFKTINGPDLYVYLAKDLEAKEFISLGKLRATEGNVNYEVPEGVDIAEYRYALVWCKQFSVLFNYADIGELTK